MADRRMLWKHVSQSRKVNSLSLPAALLWTWSIPFFDRDGYMEAEADFFKLNVVPRRVDVEESAIPTLVNEIVSKGLWISFHDARGCRVVFDPKFKDLQKIEYKKEAPSRWEGNSLIPDNSPSARRVLDDNSPQNQSKSNQSSEKERTELSLNKNSFNGDHQKRTTAALSSVLKKYPRFRSHLVFKSEKHPEALPYALEELAKAKDVKNPEEYVNRIVERMSGNLFEDEHTKQSQIYKKPIAIGTIFKELGDKSRS